MKNLIEVVKSKKAVIGTGLVILGAGLAGVYLSSKGAIEDFTDIVMDEAEKQQEEEIIKEMNDEE